MGSPKYPEVHDSVTLVDAQGDMRVFMVVYVDGDCVVCDSGARLATFARDEFEALFEEGEE